ncbi:unnamed protein product [Peniophora sp. CBMAI 1063]|nr:unnamed protein product [Peniophora sp. CBMAI 1063]
MTNSLLTTLYSIRNRFDSTKRDCVKILTTGDIKDRDTKTTTAAAWDVETQRRAVQKRVAGAITDVENVLKLTAELQTQARTYLSCPVCAKTMDSPCIIQACKHAVCQDCARKAMDISASRILTGLDGMLNALVGVLGLDEST